ncbi:MAG: RNA polymerase sigma factor [Gemmataceae bacterium]
MAPAIETLVGDHYDAIYRYAYRLAGQANEAEDLTQETFHKALKNRAQLREAEKARFWLFQILRNEYLLRLRDKKKQAPAAGEALLDVAAVNVPPETKLEHEELQAALNELDESYRTPLILFFFEDFSYRQIADLLDVPIGTVMSRLARAKAQLRQRLDPPDPVNLPEVVRS